MVTKLHQNDTTSCYGKRYGKRYVGDSDKRYRYDTETMEYFLPGCVPNDDNSLDARIHEMRWCTPRGARLIEQTEVSRSKYIGVILSLVCLESCQLNIRIRI